ncbi:hypothetical protein ACTI_41360 [Actinoplanes sp. OR16]|uniref:AfsR/SARP family transcriptional regulator n=1 Tax=Actinoplanes sp. OR16 TaxID=946334 RepID=UPI000F6D1C61|nr:AfsR/SARP family transcriptional regulator [Actinoplanes sp. OR16]BBH67451.1 hypothetical protein ACTI_41360 [Actinoplanes sp. OR16]
MIRFGVLGPVIAEDAAGRPVPLKGPMHRAVLARLVVARRRVVPVHDLVDDLWVSPPDGAIAAVRTFVAALRRAIEPERPARAPATLLVTQASGYALSAAPGQVDAWRFEQAVTEASTADPEAALRLLSAALSWWRGPAYADFPDAAWPRADRSRLSELRLQAVERLAAARLSLNRPAEALPDLDEHVTAHPWREEGWRLLALALYRTGRQGDALAVLRRARALLAGRLGLEPSPALRTLETDILRQEPHLSLPAPPPSSPPVPAPTSLPSPLPPGLPWSSPPGLPSPSLLPPSQPASPTPSPPTPDISGMSTPARAVTGRGGRADGGADERADPAGEVWARASSAYDEVVKGGARVRLESAVGLLRNLAVTGPGGLEVAREQRAAAVAAAEQLGDPELTARVIGAYDVPAIWTRSDDPVQAAGIVAAAERALAMLAPARGHGQEPARARLLATIAVESRGDRGARVRECAAWAEAIARELDDPGLLAFALNGVFMQSCHRTGGSAYRDEIGAELVALARRHGMATTEVLGHLIRLQAACAVAAFDDADRHAAAADQLSRRHELPLAGVFTQWYGALRADLAEKDDLAEQKYRAAAATVENAGMPGLRDGLLPLALLGMRMRRGLPLVDEGDWGPYEPWVRPILEPDARPAPEPPADLLAEALWCLTAKAAIEAGDRAAMVRAEEALTPAAAEWAGAASGLLAFEPVADTLAALGAALRGT